MTHWTDEKEVPFKAWMLNNDYIPEEVDVVSKNYWGKTGCLMFALSDGDKVNEDSIFSSPASAIAVGWRALKEEKKDIDEMTALYKKRRVNLKVAEERFGVSK